MNNHNWNDAFLDTPESFKKRVRETLNNLPDEDEKGICKMESKKVYKKRSLKRGCMIALIAAMAVGTSVFAAGKIFSIRSCGSSIPNYRTMPTLEKVQKDVGFEPKLIKKFTNGYEFVKGGIVKNEGFDVKGNSVGKTKSIDFNYNKENDNVVLSMEGVTLDKESSKSKIVDKYNNIDLRYNAYLDKVVPGDYKQTEQDKKDEAAGKYVFSYGADKVSISKVQYLSWTEKGIHYSLLAMDSKLSQDDLVKMAKEIIDAK